MELALAGRPPRRVRLYLAEHGSHVFDRQRVLDLLEQPESFLPACDVGSGEWESFNARAVVWIAMSRLSDDAAGAGEELYEHRKLVRMALAGGGELAGEILYSAPDGESRLVDYLNRTDRFVRLWEGDRLFLVNKDSVLRIVENGHGD